MSKPIPSPCRKCGGQVSIAASAGGRGSGELTSYRADCATCGTLVDYLGSTGRHDNAVRDYNRWVRDYAEPAGATSITVQGGYFGIGSTAVIGNASPSTPAAARTRRQPETKRPGPAVIAPRSNFTRGYFCAVSTLLREKGVADSDVVSLFSQGGDAADADLIDIELFREHGLMT